MTTTIITGGSKYIDIDVLACSIAYEELFLLLGIPAKAILCGHFNETIPTDIKQQYLRFENNCVFDNLATTFIIVDVSNPAYFSSFVDHEKIQEVWDHHLGFENYWQKRIGNKSHIEMVGACATLIWEQFIKHNLHNKISTASANLLSIAIISNTLNLNANVTHQRDIQALRELKTYISLGKLWVEKYYYDTTISIEKDPLHALMQDKKNIQLGGKNFSIGQLEIWSVKNLLKKYDMVNIAKKALSQNNIFWFLNMPCVSENKNYFLTTSQITQKLLSKYFNVSFRDGIGISNQLYLRKEIIHLLDLFRN